MKGATGVSALAGTQIPRSMLSTRHGDEVRRTRRPPPSDWWPGRFGEMCDAGEMAVPWWDRRGERVRAVGIGLNGS